MAYTLYIHEPVDDLPGLARRGFPPETFFSTDLDWVVEDALFESEQDGKPHVVIQAEAPDEILTVPEEDIDDALSDEDEEEWEEVPEDLPIGFEFMDRASQKRILEEYQEGRFEAGEAEVFEEEEEEEKEEEEDDWPQTLAEAVELTQSATLTETLPPQNAVVLGQPFELVQEELTPEEAKTERWFRFTLEQPTPLVDFQLPFWKRLIQALVTGR